MRICDTCVRCNKCSVYNATREYECSEYKVSCKGCAYNTITPRTITKKVREGKKLVDKEEIIQVHICSKFNVELKPDDFCSWGVDKWGR